MNGKYEDLWLFFAALSNQRSVFTWRVYHTESEPPSHHECPDLDLRFTRNIELKAILPTSCVCEFLNIFEPVGEIHPDAAFTHLFPKDCCIHCAQYSSINYSSLKIKFKDSLELN